MMPVALKPTTKNLPDPYTLRRASPQSMSENPPATTNATQLTHTGMTRSAKSHLSPEQRPQQMAD